MRLITTHSKLYVALRKLCASYYVFPKKNYYSMKLRIYYNKSHYNIFAKPQIFLHFLNREILLPLFFVCILISQHKLL